MSGPVWLDAVLAAAMVGSVVVHGGPLLRGSRADVDLAHLSMGAAMAVMLTVGLGAGASLAGAAAFVPLTCYFVARTSQSLTAPQLASTSRLSGAGPPLRHATCAFAMVFMLVTGAGLLASGGAVPSGHQHSALAASTAAAASPGPTAGSSAPGLVTVVLVGLLLGTALWQLAGLRRPSVRAGFQVTTSLTMVYMLVVMA